MSEKVTTSVKLKKLWKRAGNVVSLRKFAMKLLNEGEQLAADWFDHKAGSCNESRSEKNVARVTLESSATKSARKKSKSKATTAV